MHAADPASSAASSKAGTAEAVASPPLSKMEAKKEEKKELPKTGASLLGLGAGTLLAGGGFLGRRWFGKHG